MKQETEEKTVKWLNTMSKGMNERQQALLLNLVAGCCKEADNPTPEVAETESERRARKAKEAAAMGAFMSMGRGMGMNAPLKPPKKPGEPLDVLYVPEKLTIPIVEDEPVQEPEPPKEKTLTEKLDEAKPNMTKAMQDDLDALLSGTKDFGIPPEVLEMLRAQSNRPSQSDEEKK